ncbi:MAG: GNAT family N-acetyltransferase [Saprospiraceae bacterium]|nr:GNAT family N-acetyltransferase [Saprospiraceae bacterium]
MDLEFREYQPNDFESLAEMVLGLYSKDGSKATEMSREKVALSVERLTDSADPGKIFIFEKNGQIVGYCILNRFWSNEFSGYILYVDELFVQKANRGERIGERFFDHLAKLPENDFVAFMLETTPDNQKAINFYQRIGFSTHHNHLMFKQLDKNR